MKWISPLLAAFLLIVPLSATARAARPQCSCQNLDGEEQNAQSLLDDSDAVVLGRVASTRSTGTSDVVDSRVTIDLIYKGDNLGSLIEVRSRLSDGPCGFPSIADSETYVIALKKEDVGYSTGACRFLAVNYYEPSGIVSSDVYGGLVTALGQLAPPHRPTIPTPLPNPGDDIAHRNDGRPVRGVLVAVLVGLLVFGGGFAVGRITSPRV